VFRKIWIIGGAAAMVVSVNSLSPAYSADFTRSDVKCLVQLQGITYLDGICEGFFWRNGTFHLKQGELNARALKVPTVGMVPLISYQEKDLLSAHEIVKNHMYLAKKGACWVASNVRVCAWKIDEDRWFANGDRPDEDARPFMASRDVASHTIASTVGDKIRTKCLNEWPDDYDMQLYCVNKQRKAYEELNQ